MAREPVDDLLVRPTRRPLRTLIGYGTAIATVTIVLGALFALACHLRALKPRVTDGYAS